MEDVVYSEVGDCDDPDMSYLVDVEVSTGNDPVGRVIDMIADPANLPAGEAK